jgi:hypothetical protein
MAGCLVPGNGEQPRPKLGRISQRSQRFESGQERVLNDIFCNVPVVHRAEYGRPDEPLVSPHENGKRLDVVGLDQINQFRVAVHTTTTGFSLVALIRQ